MEPLGGALAGEQQADPGDPLQHEGRHGEPEVGPHGGQPPRIPDGEEGEDEPGGEDDQEGIAQPLMDGGQHAGRPRRSGHSQREAHAHRRTTASPLEGRVV